MNTGRPIKRAAHLRRLEQMPVGEPMTTPQLCQLWGVTNAWPTLEYLLQHDLCRWRKLPSRHIKGAFVYYRPQQ